MKSVNWRLVLAVALWLGLVVVLPTWIYARAQCPPGGCPSVPRPYGPALPPPVYVTPAVNVPSVQLRFPPEKPGVVVLYVDGTARGEFDTDTGRYTRVSDGEVFDLRTLSAQYNPRAKPAEAPKPKAEPKPEVKAVPRAGVCDCDHCPGGDCPCGCKMPKPEANYGLDRDKLGPERGERYSISGRDACREECLSAIAAAGGIPDDSQLVRLTVIGTDAARKAVLDDLKSSPALAWLRDKVVVKDYAADHWRVRDGGFVTPKATADAVVYAQKPDGTVLWRQDTYAGPDRLAKALRDKVPGYDPSKDPQPQPPAPVPGPSPAPGPVVPNDFNLWWLAVPGAVLLFLLLKRRS